MKITITNHDENIPVIVRTVRVDREEKEIDTRSESQLLPDQTADFEIGENESVVVFKR